MSPNQRKTCPCGLCGTPTPMLGTKRCDFCFELEGRVRRDPALARRILAELEPPAAYRELLSKFGGGYRYHEPDNMPAGPFQADRLEALYLGPLVPPT